MAKLDCNSVYVFIGRVTIFILITICLLFLAEWIYRAKFNDQFRASIWRVNAWDFYPKPYVMSTADPQAKDINRLGYKTGDWTLAEASGKKKVFIFGGSTVFYGMPNFTASLGIELQDSGYEFFNLGVTTSNSTQDLIRLLLEVLPYKPDIVLFYGPANDVFNSESRLGFPHRFSLYENNPLWGADDTEYSPLALFLFKSRILRNYAPNYFTKAFFHNQRFTQESNPWVTPRLTLLLSNLRAAKTLADSVGAKFIYVIQPTIYDKGILTASETPFAHENLREGWIETRSTLPTLLKNNGITYWDFQSLAFREEDCFADYLHLNQYCQEKLNEAFVKKFREYLKLK